MYICIYVYMYTCIYVYMYICIYVYMYICIYVYMYICIHVYMYTCIYVYMYICIYICICINVYMYICEWGHSYGIPLYPQHVQSHLNQPRVTQPVVLWLKTPNCNSPGKQGSHAEAVVFWSLNRIEQPIELHTQRDISDIISDSQVISRRSPTEPTSG